MNRLQSLARIKSDRTRSLNFPHFILVPTVLLACSLKFTDNHITSSNRSCRLTNLFITLTHNHELCMRCNVQSANRYKYLCKQFAFYPFASHPPGAAFQYCSNTLLNCMPMKLIHKAITLCSLMPAVI